MSTYTEDAIISLCHDPATKVLSELQCSNRVVRISDSLAVKFGRFVTAQEFQNQQVAKQCLDANIVNVPTAHRYIKKKDIGYIVMDYVNGDTLDLASAKPMAEELGKVLDHIHRHGATKAGPLGGGPVAGVLWPEHEEVEFSETHEFQVWFDKRSHRLGHKADLRHYALCMCHLDFNPRNIIVDGNRIYLIDWSAAGYFPRFFEHILYQFMPQDLGFLCLLEPFLAPLSAEEMESANIVVKILRHSQFHVL
jgi:tRNA A-37 threonylcarbamoyl transferase component Bud32